MSATIPEREPDVFVAGDTVRWIRSLSDYTPDDGWTLIYAFASSQGVFTVTATDNGDGRHLVELDAAVSATIVPDTYSWSGAVEKAGERFTVGNGTTTVTVNLQDTVGPIDTRTHARKVLDAIEAVLEGTATTDQASYSLEGVSISRMPIPDLLAFRDRYRAEVMRQEHADRIRKGLGHRGNILVRL